MNYHNITKDDMLNGTGLRVVLWVSGCAHACPGCQNPQTWEQMSGIPFDKEAMDEMQSFRKIISTELHCLAATLCSRAIVEQ